jgi:hypothetical protein
VRRAISGQLLAFSHPLYMRDRLNKPRLKAKMGEKCHLIPGYTRPVCWDKYQWRGTHFEVLLLMVDY